MKTLLQYTGETINRIEHMSRPEKVRLFCTASLVFIAIWGLARHIPGAGIP